MYKVRKGVTAVLHLPPTCYTVSRPTGNLSNLLSPPAPGPFRVSGTGDAGPRILDFQDKQTEPRAFCSSCGCRPSLVLTELRRGSQHLAAHPTHGVSSLVSSPVIRNHRSCRLLHSLGITRGDVRVCIPSPNPGAGKNRELRPFTSTGPPEFFQTRHVTNSSNNTCVP